MTFREAGPILGKVDFVVAYTAGMSGGAVNCYAAPGTDADFFSQSCAALCRLNETVREILGLTGKKFIVAQKPDDIGRGSRAPDEDDFYKRSPAEIAGFYEKGTGLMAVTAQRYDRKTGGYADVKDPGYVVPHEAFHAFDEATGLSDLPEFMDAYRLDVLFGLHRQGSYGYQLQPGGRGRKEALAEAGCEMTAGGCRAGPMSQHWPHTFSLVKAFVEAVHRDFDFERDFDADFGCLRTEFIAAAMHDAEKTVLPGLMAERKFLETQAASRRRYTGPAGEVQEKIDILQAIAGRHGPAECETAFLAYRDGMNIADGPAAP